MAALIPALLTLALEVMRRWPELIKIARQNGEMTAEQEAEFDKRRNEAYAKSHWQPTDTPTPPSA